MAVIAELTAVISSDTSGFDAGISEANNKLNELGKGAGQAAGNAADQFNAAGKAAAGMGAAMLAPIAGAVMMASDFEFAMDGVNAALGGVDTETMGMLEAQARELGSSSKFSATEVAAMQEELAKTGFTAEQLLGPDGLNGATKAVLDLAAATGEELVPSANLVANAIQSFGLDMDSTSRVADIFTSSLNQSAMSIPDLQRGLNYLGPAMATLDKYTEMTAQGLNGQEEALIDANAALALFNQRGLKAANTGVSLARLFDELADPTSDAADAMAQYGIDAFDAQGRMKDLPDLLDEIGEGLDGLSDEERIKAIGTIFGQQSKDVVDQMVRAFREGGLGDEFRDIAEGMREEGLAARQAAIRQDNLLGSVEKLGGALNDLGIAMGTPLLDPLNEVTKGVTEMVDVLAGAPEPVQRLVAQFSALGGGLLTFGGLAALGTGQTLKLAEQFSKAGLSLPKFTAGLLGVGAALGLGLLAYETNFLGFRDKVDEAMSNAGLAVENFGNSFDEVFSENKAAGLNDLAAGITAFGSALNAATGIDITPLTRKLADAVQRFGDTFQRISDYMQGAGFNEIASGIAALGESIDEVLGTNVAPFFHRLADAAQVFGTAWEDARANGLDPFTSALIGTRDAIGELMGVNLEPYFADLGGAVRSGLDGVGAFKDALLAGDWSAAWDGLQGGLDDLQTKIGEMDLGGKLQGVSDQLGEWFQDVGDLLFGGFDSMGGPGERDIEGLIPKLAGDIADGFGKLPQLIGEKLAEIDNPFDAIGTWMQEQTSDGSMLDSVTKAAMEFGGTALDAITTGIDDGLRGGATPQAGLGGTGVAKPDYQEAIGGILNDFKDAIVPALQDATRADAETVQQAKELGQEFGGTMMESLIAGTKQAFQPREMAAGMQMGGGYYGSAVDDAAPSWGDAFAEFEWGIWDGMKPSLEREWEESVKPGIGEMFNEKLTELFTIDMNKPNNPFRMPNMPFVMPVGAEGEEGQSDKIGKQLGEALGKTIGTAMTSEKFTKEIDRALKQAPEEVFTAVGGALLGQMTKGMATAMKEGGDETERRGAPGGMGMGQQMVDTLATGLTESLAAAKPETFLPAATGMIGQLNNALGVAMADASSQFVDPSGAAGALPIKGGGMGQQMVQSLAQGLTDSITSAPVETFLPATSALGTQLSDAMTLVRDGITVPTGASESTQAAPGFGAQMVTGLAQGLTDSINGAPAETFIPVTSALGTKLGEAMSLAAQPVQPAGGVGPVAPDSGVGTSMVQGLATGLTDSIANAPVEVFHPVSNALGAKLGESLKTAMTQTVGVGDGEGARVGAESAGGIGTQMVQGLATGLQESIVNTPVETFQPVGAALGDKLGEALQVAMEAPRPAPGADGGATTNIGTTMVEGLATSLTDSITSAPAETFAPVGTAVGQKLGEALQTVAEGGGELDISQQVGDSVGQMLQGGIEGADFSGVGEQLTTQLSDQLNQAVEEVSGQIEETMGQMTEAISEAVGQMGEAIGEATEQVSQAVEEMAQGIEEAVGAVEEAVSQMAAAVEEAAGQMEEAASSAVDAASEIGTAAEEAAQAVESAMQSMAAAVQAAAGAIEGAAGQIIAALNSIAGAAAAAGAAIGSALAGGFSDSLGIASPSKVFVGFGKNIVEGLAKGMGGNLSILSKGSNSLAKQSMSTLANAIGMGSPAKKFMPHGAAITQGMLQGMLQEAKGRMQSAMGQMAGAVESGMGKVKSAMASGMERVRSQGQQQASSMGAATASAAAEGMTSEERQAERAARRLWRRAYRELMNGVGAARFLGEEWAREFWEGMLDSSGTLEFAQYVTSQIVGAAENAITAALGQVEGLATQLEIVAGTIDTLTSDLERLESELAGIGQQEQQQRLSDAREELSLQQQITRELEERFKTQFSAAHQAHIRAMQTGSAAAQADYEHKLRVAQATDTAIAESRIREDELSSTLNAMIAAMADATREELALRKQAVLDEIALKKQQLAQEAALQASLTAAQSAAQMDYTNAVIDGSQDRIRQLEKELRKASGPEQKRTIQAQIQLEQQRIALAQQLATALQNQAAIGDTTSAAYAQANAQVQFLTSQIEALGEVDVASLLSGIVSDLGKAASTLSSAASSMSSAAEDMGSMEATAPVQAATAAAAEFGTEAAVAERGMFSMANAYDKVMADMRADGEAFQAQFEGMIQKTAADGAAGGAAIGEALSTGISSRIEQGGEATQTAMLQHLNGAVDETTGEAIKGGDVIATEFGTAMRGQMGVELSQVHQQVLGGMTKTVGDSTTIMDKGGTDIAGAFGQTSKDKLDQEIPKFQTAMDRGMNKAVGDSYKIAEDGGKDIAGVLTDGLKAGIDSKGGIISNATAGIVRQAIQAARDQAKAQSPSLEMMHLGHDMGDGLILGLGDRERDAEDASARLVHIPMNPTSGGGITGKRAMQERGSRGGNTYVFNIEELVATDVTNGPELIEFMERFASANGVASGR